MIVAIIRSKSVAILLGPSGFGVLNMLLTSLGLISSLTNFGIDTSAVKDISNSYVKKDLNRISIVYSVIHRLVKLTGLIAVIIVIIFSNHISLITYGNDDYNTSIILVSFTLLLDQMTKGKRVILQGTRNLRFLAKSTMLSSVTTLGISLPLYYVMGVDGIIPSLIVGSLISYLIARYYVSKLKIVTVKVTLNEVFGIGADMLRMGFLISISGLLTLLVSFLLKLMIEESGGIVKVGLYSAGYAIITNYVGLIFNAMGTDYYPRLAAQTDVQTDIVKSVNEQAEMAILILAPVVAILIAFIERALVLLYSNDFVAISEMVKWMSLGMLFKACSWSLSYVFIAHSDKKMFFLNELSASIYMLVFNLFGYYFGGFQGLGISFVISYLIYFIQVAIVGFKIYNISLSSKLFAILLVQFVLILFLLLITQDEKGFIIIKLLVVSIITIMSTYLLSKRIDLLSYIKLRFWK